MKKVFRVCTMILASTIIIFILNNRSSNAAPAYPGVIEATQPNGQVFQARINGNEWSNWTTSVDEDENEEYVIVEDSDGYWKYAEVSFGELKPSESRVGIDEPSTEPVKGTEWVEQVDQYSEDAIIPEIYYAEDTTPQMAVPLQPTGGPHKILAILVSFTNISIQNSEAAWSDKFFGDTGDTVKNFYKENSFGNFYFDPVAESFGTANDGVVKVTLNYAHPNPDANTDDRNRNIVRNALIAADAYVNFASYDTNGNGYIETSELHIVTIVAGYERSCGVVTPNVWGHRWSLFGAVSPPQLDGKFVGAAGYGGYTQQGEIHAISGNHMATIGILAHELGHDLGAVDLYNTSSGSSVVGVSSLMDGGSWGKGPTDYPGGSPAHFDPWHKSFLAFVTPTTVASGIQTLKSAATGQYNIIKLTTSNPDEYFLVENRQRSGFDDGLYYDYIINGGIAIWHIEEGIIGFYKASNAVNATGHNPGVWLEKAVSSSDPYYRLGGAKDTFNDTSTPNSKLYSGLSSSVSIKVLDTSGTSMRVQIGDVVGAQLQFSPTTYTVAENTESIALTVTRTGDTSGVLTVDYATSNGTATAGSDFTSTSGTLTFADGEASKTITIPIIDDTAFEGNESLTVTLSNPSSGTITSSTATITITDNDSIISFDPTLYSVSEAAGNAILTVKRNGITTTAVDVDYVTANVTATSGSDYTATSGTMSFAAGQISKTITVLIINDTIMEGVETFNVSLSNPTNGAAVISGTATVSIGASDIPSIAISPGLNTVTESDGTVSFTVTRGGDSLVPISVDYATSNGSAIAGSDYVAISGTINFASGETTKTININIIDDLITEPEESFTISLSNPIGGAVIVGSAATATIQDDDLAPQIAFNPTSYFITEDSGSVTITVQRTGNTSSAVEVDYVTSNNTALAGSEYTAASGTLSFANGESTKTISIPIIDDINDEANESFAIVLSNPTGGAILINTTATVNIIDNDDPPVITFDPASYSVNEEDGTVALTVKRSVNTNTSVTVDYATNNGTAVAGTDYTLVSGTITFAPGETVKTINITILDDTDPESGETFRVILSNPSSSAQINNDTAIVTISANDGYVAPAQPKSLGIDPNIMIPDVIGVGDSQSIVVLAVLEDNSTADVTSLVQWNIGNTGVISINNGVITALGGGLTKVTATYEGKSCYFYIAVE